MSDSHFPPFIIAAAQASQRKYPVVPACVTLAQWAEESGYGQHTSAPHNYFGIKARDGEPFKLSMTREVYNGKSVWLPQKFRAYANDAEAFTAHAELLADREPYAAARAAEVKGGWRAFVVAMAERYATAQNYATTIIGMIEAHHLDQYDVKPAAHA